jgi:acyl-CoA dehydrogenase
MMDLGFLEWPFFTKEHIEFARRLDAFCREELIGVGTDHDESDAGLDRTCREIARSLGQAGFLSHCVVEAPGGAFDVRRLCLGREILAAHRGLADFVFAMQGLGTGPISLFGTEEQRKRYLPAVARGENIAAFALSEPNTGSDVAAMTTNAVRDGTHYVINGSKTWISNGGIAAHYVVFARTGEAPGAKGLSAFIVDADTPGLRIAERVRVIAPHPLATLKFEDCRVPSSTMLGSPGEGFQVAMGTLDVFRTTVGAAALGFARRALQEALGRVLERDVFGKKLSTFQLTQAKIADMGVGVDAAALLVYRAAWTRDTAKRRITREASMAKLYATETAQEVIDMAVQLFGGTGVVSGKVVETLYREIRALRIYEGTSEIQRLVIANEILKSFSRANHRS